MINFDVYPLKKFSGDPRKRTLLGNTVAFLEIEQIPKRKFGKF